MSVPHPLAPPRNHAGDSFARLPAGRHRHGRLIAGHSSPTAGARILIPFRKDPCVPSPRPSDHHLSFIFRLRREGKKPHLQSIIFKTSLLIPHAESLTFEHIIFKTSLSKRHFQNLTFKISRATSRVRNRGFKTSFPNMHFKT